MPLTKLDCILKTEVTELAKKQPLKGNEQIITGVKPATGSFGPRFYIAGQGQKEFLCMNSNSYLGLSLNPQVIQAEEAASKKFGAGPGAVRFISGTYQHHIDLEDRLAAFHNKDKAMLFSAAYATVLGVLFSIISKDSVVISDALNHNSIINALRLARPAAKGIYKHLDLDDLENQLNTHHQSSQRALVITDGIFSMRGDHAPLKEISALCAKYDARYEEGVILVVDDSHGVGVFGKTGRGTEEYCGASADILIGTLGKAIGINGGYVATSSAVIDFLREQAPMYIYSNPITPSESAAALKALEIIDSSTGITLLDNVRSLSRRFENGLTRIGFETITSEHPIVPLMVRDTAKTSALTKHLFDNEILATGLNFPVVPKGDEEIRFQISANHTEQDIDFALQVLEHF